MFFFFQAEDGIRDSSVTGVQTCALPICPDLLGRVLEKRGERDGADGLDDGFLRLLGKSSFDDLAKSVVAGGRRVPGLVCGGLVAVLLFYASPGRGDLSVRRGGTCCG